jgi:hypothetical protein
MRHNKVPSKVSAIDKTQAREEFDDDDEDDDDDDGDCDNPGSKVVATLCRTVKSQQDEKDLVIAVVVSSGGSRHDAQKCAKAHIKKLKGEGQKRLTCRIIADLNKPETKVKEEEEEEETGEGEEIDEEEDDDDQKEGTSAESERVDYTPKDFLDHEYKNRDYPLGGGKKQHEPADVIGLLKSNYDDLKKTNKDGHVDKSTWLVLHRGQTSASTAVIKYYKNHGNQGNQVVVVVLSKRFFYPKAGQGRETVISPILVCNVPYRIPRLSDEESRLGRYKGIFHQIDVFLTEYNTNRGDYNYQKIGIIAISYPTSVTSKVKNSPKTVQSKSTSKSKPKKATGKKKPKPKKASTETEGDEGAQEDEDPDSTEHESDMWLRALREWKGDTIHEIEIKLMYDKEDAVWYAPDHVKKYFEDNDGLLKKFPECIEKLRDQKTQKETINLDELETTMFVCDLEPKSRVGNANDNNTTGGVFGQWVPMHYTAAYINRERYNETSVNEIDSLIDIVFTNQVHTGASETIETDADETTSGISEVEESEDERRKLVNTMKKIYTQGYGPPEWVGDKYIDKDHFGKNAPKAKLFYDNGADLSDVKKVANEREPVNIAMDRFFDLKMMETEFGYRTSYYQRYYDEYKELAPNIGVLTYSLIRVPDEKDKNKYTDLQMNIYHAIGAALDSEDQPDYKFFVEWTGNGVTHDRDLINFYVSVFMKILSAATYCKAKGIVMSLVGADAYASKYPGGKNKMQKNVWIPAFKFVLEYWSWWYWSDNKEKKVFALMCDPQKSQKDPAYKYMTKHLGADSVGKFPEFLSDQYEKYKDWMIVNAWDCHAIPGNGNEKDDTLDGFIGRISEIQYLGWGEANQHLLKTPARVYVPWYSDDKESEADSNKQSAQSGPAANTRSTKKAKTSQPSHESSESQQNKKHVIPQKSDKSN